MKARCWSTREDNVLRAHYHEMELPDIADYLGRTESAVRCRALKLRINTRRLFAPEEIEYVRQHAGDTCEDVAKHLGRPVPSIYGLRNRLGIANKQPHYGPEFEAFVRDKHALGWCDAEIAQAYGCERHTVGEWRQKLGLPHNAYSEHRRRAVAQKTREQLQAAGVGSLSEVRRLAFRKYAKEYGWPEDLGPREVQILNALMKNGPMTRRQIAEAIGMPWRGSRASLKGNGPGGSYMAILMRRGLVVHLGRCVKGQGRNQNVYLYTVPLWIERNTDGQQAA